MGMRSRKRSQNVFRKSDYEAQTKVKMTKLGAPKNPDLGVISNTVPAWRDGLQRTFFLVEAKRLTSCSHSSRRSFSD